MSVATKLHSLRQVASNGYMQAGPVPEWGGGVGRGEGSRQVGGGWKEALCDCIDQLEANDGMFSETCANDGMFSETCANDGMFRDLSQNDIPKQSPLS